MKETDERDVGGRPCFIGTTAAKTYAFRLAERHVAVLDRWADLAETTRSQALRGILEALDGLDLKDLLYPDTDP